MMPAVASDTVGTLSDKSEEWLYWRPWERLFYREFFLPAQFQTESMSESIASFCFQEMDAAAGT
jgi:hypothetical protein